MVSLFLMIAVLWMNRAFAIAEDPLPDGLYAEITTLRGTIIAKLYDQKAPLTVINFVGLAEGKLGPEPRKPFFDGLTFHRVVPGFVIQGGDPLKNGEGGPGYEFPDEFSAELRHDSAGVLSMANDGPDTNGSQFFVTLSEVNRLNFMHSVFGKVIRGLDVLPRIEQGDTMQVKILRIGAEAKAFKADQETFDRIAATKPKAVPPHFDDADGLLPAEPPRAKGFDHRLENFERFTGQKIYGRVYKEFLPTVAGQTTIQFTKELAGKFGTQKSGMVVTYFEKTDDWKIWVGDQEVARFTKLNGGADLHTSKQAFFKAVGEAGDRMIADAAQGAPADTPLPDAQKIKLRLDAVFNRLIDLMETEKE
jgi:cyclophilin family peptidyl-prolyl cis-trans isomerase